MIAGERKRHAIAETAVEVDAYLGRSRCGKAAYTVDQDAIRDAEEGAGCVGQKGVPALPPWNGCFDGPVPPRPGGASVVIRSLKDDNPDNTASVQVVLELSWPKGTRKAVANNSAGDQDVPIPLKARVPWTLRPARKSETREVEVKFTGPGIAAKDSDTITLDPLPPTIPRTLLLRSGSGRWYVGMRAVDDRGGSGVSRIDLLDRHKRQMGRGLRVCYKATCPGAVTSGRQLPKKPRFLRAIDAAGNVSRLMPVAVASASCTIKVPMGGVSAKCFQIGDHCRRSNPPYFTQAAPALVCRKHKVRHKARKR